MGIKGYIYLVIFIVLAAALGSAYWYYNWSQEEIKVLRENNVKLKIVDEQQKETIAVMQEDAHRAGEQLMFVNQEFEAARKENSALRNTLSKHNIGYLASKKPKWVGKILSNGTNDSERCFEILSGAELTQKEKMATKKSQLNTSCPSLANPNFKGNLK